MDVIVERCAGLDVHRDSVVAAVRVPGTGKSRRRRAQQTRTFGTTIAQLEQLADWLAGFAVSLVGMEATGVYWVGLSVAAGVEPVAVGAAGACLDGGGAADLGEVIHPGFVGGCVRWRPPLGCCPFCN